MWIGPEHLPCFHVVFIYILVRVHVGYQHDFAVQVRCTLAPGKVREGHMGETVNRCAPALRHNSEIDLFLNQMRCAWLKASFRLLT